MPAADTTVVVVNSPAARSAPTATDTWFVVGPTATDGGLTEVRGIGDFDTTYGSGSGIRAAVDAYFRLGGARAYISPAADAAAVDAALALFTADLGPGQVSAPGLTDGATHQALLDHAADRDNNRFAILDAPDTGTVATIVTAASLDNGKYGEMWSPWAVVRGATPGTTTTIPYSAVQAALYARNDSRGVPRSQPPAGKDYGIVDDLVVSLSQPAFSATERDTLEEAGVSVARTVDGQIASWSNRTLDTSEDPRYSQSSEMRVLMALTAQFRVVGRRYELKRVDGRRHLISQFGSDLTAVCKAAWDVDDLYGETAGEAYRVDVGETVNTPTTIAAKELHANIDLTVSESANSIRIQLVQHIIGQSA